MKLNPPTVVCAVCEPIDPECAHVRAFLRDGVMPDGADGYPVTVEVRAYYDLTVLARSSEAALTASNIVEEGDEWARSRSVRHVYWTHGGSLRRPRRAG